MGVKVDTILETSASSSFSRKFSTEISSVPSSDIQHGGAINGKTKILATKECQHCLVQQKPYKQFLGREYYYSFDNGIVKQEDGSSCHMRGSLLAIFPFGKILHQDLAALLEEGAKTLKWGEELGLVSKSDPKSWNRIVQAAPEYLAALMSAGLPLASAKLAIIWNFTSFVFDDILEEALPYKELVADIWLLVKYLTEDDEEKLPIINSSEGSPHVLGKLPAFCAAMRSMHKLARESGANPTYFFDLFREYLLNCALETHELLYTAQELEYAFSKTRCQAQSLAIELCFLVNKLDVPPEIRADPMFTLLCHLVGVHAGLFNDLLSLKKELKLGEIKNTVLVRAKARGSLQQGFDSVLEETNAIAKRILELRTKILLCYPDNELVSKAVHVAMNFTSGHMNYFVNNARYITNDIYFTFSNV